MSYTLEECEIPRDCHVYFQNTVDLRTQNDNMDADVNVVLHDDEDPTGDGVSSDTSIEANSPIEAIDKLRMDPRNVMIAKYGDNYYVDHNDLKCYMDACKENKYEAAMNNIMMAHDDLEPSNMRVAIRRSDYDNMSESTKMEINRSNVSFDLFG